jgi:hypothetical protein
MLEFLDIWGINFQIPKISIIKLIKYAWVICKRKSGKNIEGIIILSGFETFALFIEGQLP